MNREIKFRGARVANNQMIYGYFVVAPNGEHRIYMQPFPEATNNTYYSVWNNSVSQFTGQQDCNDKDIYEGDIIKTGTDKVMCVRWSQKHASFVIDREGWAFLHYFGEAFDGKDCEVIGNKFENPELLVNKN